MDPIFPVQAWQDVYADFFASAAKAGHRPSRITLGTYRETQPTLQHFSRRWGLPALEFRLEGLERDGAHYHLNAAKRLEIYRTLSSFIARARPASQAPIVALCKEPRSMRVEVGLDHDKRGGGLDAKTVMNMNYKEFSELSEDALARLRGDTL